jgi:hypothetical protein
MSSLISGGLAGGGGHRPLIWLLIAVAGVVALLLNPAARGWLSEQVRGFREYFYGPDQLYVPEPAASPEGSGEEGAEATSTDDAAGLVIDYSIYENIHDYPQ